MKQIVLNGTEIASEQQLHQLLAQALDFPEWYGNNLDALMDCLTDLEDVAVTLTRWETLPFEAEGFWRVFRQAAEENPDLTVMFA